MFILARTAWDITPDDMQLTEQLPRNKFIQQNEAVKKYSATLVRQ